MLRVLLNRANNEIKLKKIIYLDNASTTPVDPKVFMAMKPYFSDVYGNPSSLHSQGVKSKHAVESARKNISNLLGTSHRSIIFTAGGTESINLAIRGAVYRAGLKGVKKPHVITTQIEHPSVLECVRSLKLEGVEVTELAVDSEGFVRPEDVLKAVKEDTVLVSIMYANNEIGTIEPITSIVRKIQSYNKAHRTGKFPVLVHTDACQALGYLDCNVNSLGVDLLSANASKINGPKQVGFLYVRQGIELMPIIYGGGQERGYRSGTENVPGVVGMSKAMEITLKGLEKEAKRVTVLRNYLWNMLRKEIKGITINGPTLSDASHSHLINRLPNNLNFSIPGVEAEALLLYLDAQGICVSTGSACSESSTDDSHVLTAIGKNSNLAKSSIRISLGKLTTKQDLDTTAKTFKQILSKYFKADK